MVLPRVSGGSLFLGCLLFWWGLATGGPFLFFFIGPTIKPPGFTPVYN